MAKKKRVTPSKRVSSATSRRTAGDILPAEAAQQYFPTYRIPEDKEEVALREYDLSAQALSAEQRSISIATGLLVLVIGFSGTLLGSEDGLGNLRRTLAEIGPVAEVILLAGIFGIALVVVRYFADLQRSATYAARKIVVLRRLLGIDYGTQEKVLPTRRIEGANEPFAIAMFPGWGSIGSLATVVVSAFAATLLALLVATLAEVPDSWSLWLTERLGEGPIWTTALAVVPAFLLLLIYRAWLFDSWETKRFLLGSFIARELGVPLKDRMGHVLYRLELSVYEARRVGILLEAFIPILISVEDKRFFTHRGNDWRAVGRAGLNWWRYGSRSGGSTIDQQLFRSNCLTRMDKTFARKPVEWVMGPWIRSLYSADQVLHMYLCSVRFDRDVLGLAAAAVHFFDMELHSTSTWVPTKAQVFFLVDRLSNVSRTIPTARIRARLKGLIAADMFSAEDIAELKRIYLDQIGKGLINGTISELEFVPD